MRTGAAPPRRSTSTSPLSGGSVRSRIVGLAIWASVLAIGLFGVPLGVAVLQYALQAERSELQGVADAVAIVVAGDVYDDEQIGYVSRQGAIELAVYDHDGELL